MLPSGDNYSERIVLPSARLLLGRLLSSRSNRSLLFSLII